MAMHIHEESAQRVRAFHQWARCKLGVKSQRDVGDYLGVREAEYSNMMHGRRSVAPKRLIRWARAVDPMVSVVFTPNGLGFTTRPLVCTCDAHDPFRYCPDCGGAEPSGGA